MARDLGAHLYIGEGPLSKARYQIYSTLTQYEKKDEHELYIGQNNWRIVVESRKATIRI